MRVSPPRPVTPAIAVTQEQGALTWVFEYSFPNFFVAYAGNWVGLNIDFNFNTRGELSFNDNSWVVEFDLSKFAADVVAEGEFLEVNSEVGRLVSRYLGRALKGSTCKVRFVVTANIDVTSLDTGSSIVVAAVLTLWAKNVVLSRNRLRLDLIEALRSESGQSGPSDSEQ